MNFRLLLIFIISVFTHNLYALEYKAYQFHNLVRDLGLPDETYFNSTEEEIFDLDLYTSKEDAFYQEINGYLRFHPAPYDWNGTSPEQARLIVSNIDRIFERAPKIPHDLILFRGVSLKHRKNAGFKLGEEFVEKGYLSTSTSYKVAEHFAGKKDDRSSTGKNALFVIYQEAQGQKGILIDKNEDEVLLKRGLRLKIMAFKKNNPVYTVYLVQACPKKCNELLNQDIARFWAKSLP